MGFSFPQSLRLCWLALLFVSPLGASAQEAPPRGAEWNDISTTIVPDSSLGTRVEISPGLWTIPESPGERAGQNLFHSFSRFDLAAGDRARFEASAPTLQIINRITGASASRINGILDSSEVAGAQLYFLNPSGVFFGPSARLDVAASFHGAAADSLEFESGESFPSTLGADPPLLSVASPTAFGFAGTGNAGPLSLEASVLIVPNGHELHLAGGDVEIEAGILLAGGRTSSGVAAILLEARRDLLIRGDTEGAGQSLLWAASEGEAPAGGIRLSGGRDVVLLNSRFETFSLGAGNAGELEIEAGSLLLTSGIEARSLASGSGNAGDIGLAAGESAHLSASRFDASVIDLSEGTALPSGAGGRIRIAVGDSTTTPPGENSQPNDLVLDGTTLLVANQGNSPIEGRIELAAERITLENASLLGAVPASIGAGGSNGNSVIIELEALESITLQGSGLTTGTGSDTSGSIRLAAPKISLTGKGVITSTTYGAQDAGTIRIAGETIEIDDDFGIVGNGLASGADSGRGADILLEAESSLSLGEGVGIHSSTLGDGDAGGIVIGGRNGQRPDVRMRGASLTTLADFGVGNAGTIEIEARQLSLSQGSAILSASRATTAETGGARPGSAGSVSIVADEVRLSDASGINVFAEVGPDVPADLGPGDPSPPGVVDGNIAIRARDLLMLAGESQIEASVGTGLGGSIAIGSAAEPSAGVVLRERSVLLARASGEESAGKTGASHASTSRGPGRANETLAARGGDIRIDSLALFSCPDCLINADGPTTRSVGSIVVNNPETAIENQAVPSNISYLDASSQMLERCGVQNADTDPGRFTVSRWPGRPPSPEGPLLAFAPLGSGLGVEFDEIVSLPPRRTSDRLAYMDEAVDGGENEGMPEVIGDEIGDETGTAIGEKIGEKIARESGREPAEQIVGEQIVGERLVIEERRDETDDRNPPAPAAAEALLLAIRGGNEALRGGRSQRADDAFERAEARAAALGNVGAQSDALRGQAEARQLAGRYAESLAPLEEALALARRSGDPLREAAALGALGNAYVALAEFEKAESLLGRAVVISRGGSGEERARAGLVAALLNNLGNQRAIAGNTRGALAAYRESADEALVAGQPLRAAQAEANAARTALELGLNEETRGALEDARRALAGARLAPAEDATLHIHLAHTEARLARRDATLRRPSLLAAHADLLRASRSAEVAEDLRSGSHALGNLGALYAEEGGREAEALYLTGRALQLAENQQAADLMARWHAQSGRLHWRGGRVEEALDAYRRAVALLGETRPEASHGYGSADAAFRQAVEPVYLSLVDALLQSSESLPEGRPRQARLAEARQGVEQWKAAELRNYFRDSCAAQIEERSIDLVDPRAAIIYPIALPNRLEILVSRASGIERYTIALQVKEFERRIEEFRRGLAKRTTREYKRPAQQLYQWLVAPYAASLEAEGIDTLVFVPGGALRTVPMAALHDGEGFLLERFAVAVTPSLNLLAPKALVPSEAQVLLAGLSESVQGFPALPSVPGELAAIENLYGGDVLLNGDFGFESLQSALRNKPPGMVHIASHAEFNGDPDTSFVLTHGDRLSMEQLSELLRAGRYGEEPVELLMLSACETAVGDERAALGLAGVAIRAGARSAMGSLWTVSDEATAALVVGFYEALGTPRISKARALQRAQQNLLADARFGHPFYWAPFMVINNWL